jgi:hypothetical protein
MLRVALGSRLEVICCGCAPANLSRPLLPHLLLKSRSPTKSLKELQ